MLLEVNIWSLLYKFLMKFLISEFNKNKIPIILSTDIGARGLGK